MADIIVHMFDSGSGGSGWDLAEWLTGRPPARDPAGPEVVRDCSDWEPLDRDPRETVWENSDPVYTAPPTPAPPLQEAPVPASGPTPEPTVDAVARELTQAPGAGLAAVVEALVTFDPDLGYPGLTGDLSDSAVVEFIVAAERLTRRAQWLRSVGITDLLGRWTMSDPTQPGESPEGPVDATVAGRPGGAIDPGSAPGAAGLQVLAHPGRPRRCRP